MNPYIMTVLANFSFALGSQFFTHYSKKFSSLWMNTYKALIGGVFFLLTVVCTTGLNEMSWVSFGAFILSGFIGLGVGDVFLLKAFTKIGPGRTLVLFGFHPLIVGVLSYFIFGQKLDSSKLIAVIFFLGCLMTFSYESFKTSGKWEVSGLVFAFLGMSLDGCGVLITRYAFDLSPSLTTMEGNFYRCIGALICYGLWSRVEPFSFKSNLKSLQLSSLFYVTFAAFLGTYLSLALYLHAIKTASLAIVTAISITGVIFSSLIESIWLKEWPNRYLLIAFVWFGFGMWKLLF